MALIKKYPQLEEFTTFLVIGACNTALDFCIYLSLTRFIGLYFVIANTISFSITATVSFFLNKHFTFRNKEKRVHTQYVKFIVVSVLGLLWNNLIIFSFVKFVHLHDIAAKVIAIGIVLFWNYGMNKIWSFRVCTDMKDDVKHPIIAPHGKYDF